MVRYLVLDVNTFDEILRCGAVIFRIVVTLRFILSHFLMSILKKKVRKLLSYVAEQPDSDVYFNLLAKPVSYM